MLPACRHHRRITGPARFTSNTITQNDGSPQLSTSEYPKCALVLAKIGNMPNGDVVGDIAVYGRR